MTVFDQIFCSNLKLYVAILNTVLVIFQGQATDIQIQAEEILKMKKQINQLYVKHTAKDIATIGEVHQLFTHYEA